MGNTQITKNMMVEFFSSCEQVGVRKYISKRRGFTSPDDVSILWTPTISFCIQLNNEIGSDTIYTGVMEKEDSKVFHAINRIVYLDILLKGIEQSLCCCSCSENQIEKISTHLLSIYSTKKNIVSIKKFIILFQSFLKENNNKLDNLIMHENTIGVETELTCNCKQHKVLFITKRETKRDCI